jgi:hypothetical protein
MIEIDKISVSELSKMSEKMYDSLVKAVVDVKQRRVVYE